MKSVEAVAGYLLIAPFLLMFAVFKLYPMLYGIAVGFWDRNSEMKLLDTTFVGLSNYITVLKSASFWEAFAHSIVFSVIYIVFLMVFGFLAAVLLNRKFWGRTAVRTCFYIPYVTNMIAVGIVFKYLLNPVRGPVNAIFRLFGASGPGWLSSPVMALPTAAVIAGWAALAFHIITCLAALQDIPADMYEVADIEGAGFWQKLRYIKLPLIMPSIYFVMLTAVIDAFQMYTEIFIMTKGGPGYSTYTVSYYLWSNAFEYSKMGYACAMAVILFIIIMTITLIQNKFLNREYDT